MRASRQRCGAAHRLSLVFLFVLQGAAPKLAAQGILENYKQAERMMQGNFAKLVFRTEVQPHWIGKSDRFWYRVQTREGKEFVLVDPERNAQDAAFDHTRLASALSQAWGRPVQPRQLPFDSFDFTDDGSSISLAVAGLTVTCKLTDYHCATVKPLHAPNELLSPNEEWAAFTKDHNLWVRSTATGEEFPLTSDGVAEDDYASESEYDLAFVSSAGIEKPPLAFWSPDSKRLLTHRLNQKDVLPMYLLQFVPPGGFRPVLHTYRYPLPGDAHLGEVRPIILDVEKRSMVGVQTEPLVVPNRTPGELGWTWWSEDSAKVYFIDLSRGSKGWKLKEADASTGVVHPLIEERGKTYVELNVQWGARANVRVLKNGRDIISFSERDGWAHLYLYDHETGKLKNQITSGPWVVRDVLGVDEESRKIYFTGGGREPGRDPYYRHLYRCGLDGTGIELLSPEDADHQVAMAPGGRFFVDTISRVDTVPRTVLRAQDGRIVRTLEQGDITDLLKTGWRAPEPFQAKAADGATDLYGAIYRLRNFDPAKKYAVVDSIYPGPQAIRTPKAFSAVPSSQAASVAELGFIVVTVDGRGSPLRSKAFHDYSYENLGQAGGLEDHIAVLRQLAARYPYMDLDRVGIYGHSGGGYASARALLLYPDFYKVGVSSSGNHDQREYVARWGETYQGLPAGDNYKSQGNPDLAGNLCGKLLLIHGDMDDNVPLVQTMRLVDALIRANKDFDLIVLPNRNHGSFDDPYATRRRWDYLVRHLLHVEPPAGFEVHVSPAVNREAM